MKAATCSVSGSRAAISALAAFADLDQLAADEIGRQETEQRERDEHDDEAEAGNLYRQIGLRPVGDWNEGSHQIIDPVDEPPGEADGDVGRRDQDQPGQKIIAQPADEAVMEWPQLGGFGRCVGGRCRRHDPGIAIKLVHALTIFSTSSPTE